MPTAGTQPGGSGTSGARARRAGGRARAALRERLEARRDEIESAALTRVSAISDPAEVADPAYAEGLRAAVAAAIDYGIETTGREASDPPIPVALLAQARTAARVGIPLDTVLRRYFAGYSLLGYFILEEAANAGITDGAELKRLLGAHAGIFDRLLAAVGEEHGREAETLRAPSGRRQAEQVERLLAGEPIATDAIPYDFEGWHVGIVATGPGAKQAICALAESRDCRLLNIERGDAFWAWLGARARSGALDPDMTCADSSLGGTTLALGEPGEGLAGWRLTHRQAAAALPVAQRGHTNLVRYGDTALLAAVHRDEVLARSLDELYLARLEGGRDGGAVAKETLRAYFAAGRNASAAAAALGVRRHTVASRLRAIENAIERRIEHCAAELALALRLDDLNPSNPADTPGST